MEMPNKPSHNFFPKMFKVFSLYIIITLSVFFGYVQIFGNVAPSMITLPTDDTNAADDSLFGNFVEKIAEFQNIDTDFNISFQNRDLTFTAQGNVVFDSVSGGISLTVDLLYKDQTFEISAVYLNPNLYLTINESVYKFNSSGQMDLTGLIDFISKAMNMDLSFIDEISEFLGIDLKNFDPNTLLQKLKIEEKLLEDGGVEFIIGLGSAISAQLICDKDFNVVSAKVKDILIQGNAIKFKADVNKMNKEDVVVEYEETGDEIDLSGLTEYTTYAQNLFANDFVSSNIKLSLQGKEYFGKLSVDNSNGMKVKFETNVEGLDASIAFAENIVYLDAEKLKLKFKLSDYEIWKETINSLIEKETSKSIADLVKNFIQKNTEINFESIDFQKEIDNLLSGGFNGSDKISAYLPNETLLTENSFSMLWNNGLNVNLVQDSGSLTNISVRHPSINLQADFFVGEEGVIIEGDYYDVSNLLPLSKFVDEILTTNKFGGVATVNFDNKIFEINYLVDFENTLLVKAEMVLFDEKIVLYINGQQVTLSVGEIAVEANLSEIDIVLSKIDEIFNTKFAEKLNTILQNKPDTSTIINQIVEILNNLKLTAEEGKIAVVDYLSNMLDLSVDNEKVNVHFENGKLFVDAFIKASNEQIVLPMPTDDTTSLLNKIKNIKNLVETKQFAFDFALSYKNLNLSGLAQLDLKNNIFEISNVLIGGNSLKLVYVDGTVFVDYASNKFKFEITKVKQLIEIVNLIVKSNGVEGNFDMSSVLIEIFGQDISNLTIDDALKLLSVNVTGSLDNLNLNVDFNSIKTISGQIGIVFENDEINSININFGELTGNLTLKDMSVLNIIAEEYYNITSAHLGTAKINYVNGNVNIEVDLAVELVLTDKIALKISTQILGRKIELIVLNNEFYLTIDSISYRADFNNANEILKYVVDAFEIALPNLQGVDWKEMLNTIDLNSINVLDIKNLKLDINGSDVVVEYKINDKIGISLNLKDEQIANEIVLPMQSQELLPLIKKVNSLKNYISKGIFEFDFVLEYNGLDFAGTLKYFDGAMEITDMLVCGEYVNLRLQNGFIYLSYGNMKLKFALSSNVDANLISQTVSSELGVVVDFGVFQEIIDIYKNYSVDDFMKLINLSVGDLSGDFVFEILNEKEFTTSKILRAVVGFDGDTFNHVDVEIYDILKIGMTVRKTEISTIPPFVPADYEDYSSDYVEGLFDSLKVEQDVYAFSSDIAIRYSNNQFYGKLTAMLIKDINHQGILGEYIPAVSLYTTSLGLSSFIYLVDNTIYIDINGLQISADLSKTTINEIMTFVEQKLGISLGGNAQVLETATQAFKLVLPAIDKVYGAWVSGNLMNGIQINVNDDLWYNENSRFYDIVLQAFIQNYQNTIVPTKVVLGANIDDPNTTSYDDYSQYWLDCEENITKNLNFGVYLNNILVGNNVQSLDSVFKRAITSNQITAVKSNSGTTLLTDFVPYTTLLETVGTIYDYAMSFNYGLDIKGTVSSATSNIEIKRGNFYFEIGDLAEGQTSQFEFIKGKSLNVQGGLTVVNNGSAFAVDLMYESLKSHDIYITYALTDTNKFRAKINDSNISDIIAIIQKLTNSNGQDIKDEITEIDKTLRSITDITKIIKEIKLTTNESTLETMLQLKIDIEGKGKVGTIQIVLKKNSLGVNEIDRISVSQVELAGNEINLEIKINNKPSDIYDYLEVNPAEKHIDFSGANELIKAVVNTAELNNYEIAGNLNINGNLIGIDINWKVPMNIQIKLDENRKPEVMAVIGEIPTLIGVNNDVPYEFGDTESGSGRMLYVYYKDGSVYFYRTEYVDIMFGASKRRYEKKLKVSIGEVLSNPLKYLQYCTGFTDAIIEAIQASLDLAKGHTPNLENVVKSFVANDSQNFNVTLNMKEITNDPKMDTMSIGLGVVNNEATGNKNYIGKASLNLYMPLASVFKLTLDSNDLILKDIGRDLDFAALYDYVNSYTYNEGANWEASNGKWSLESEVLYQLSFEENGGEEIADITAAPSTPIVLPTYQTRVVDDGKTKTTKYFDGWWTSPTFEEGTKFTSTKMPRGDTQLYCKWIDEVEYYRTLSFETYSTTKFDSITTLVGEEISIPVLTTKEETVDNITTYYDFDGWYTDATFTTRFTANQMPDQDTVLYAKWLVTKVEKTFVVNVYDNGEFIYTARVKSGDNINLAECPNINEKTKYFQDINYNTEYTNLIMPENDVEIHIRNEYSVTVSSAYGNVGTETFTLYQGSAITLPTQSSYVEDDGNVRTTYTFLGYSEDLTVMPNTNKTIVANWEVDSKSYYTVNFDLRFYLVLGPCVAGYGVKEYPTPINSLRVLEGTTIDLTAYKPTCRAWGTAFHVGNGYLFQATSWGVNKPFEDYTAAGSGVKEVTVTGDTTLYACWEKV